MTNPTAPWITEPGTPTSGERSAAMWVHLCMLLNLTVLPLLGLIAAIMVWRMNARSEFVNRHGWGMANLMLSLLIYGIILSAIGLGSTFVIMGSEDEETFRSGALLLLVGMIAFYGLILVIWLINLISAIIGAVRASSGKPHRYALALPLVVAA